MELAGPAPGVITAGLNEQLNLAEIDPQVSVMGWLKEPDCGVATTVNVPVAPEETVTVSGEALNEMLGAEAGGTQRAA